MQQRDIHYRCSFHSSFCLFVCVCVRLHAHTYTTRQERTLCMFCTCQERHVNVLYMPRADFQQGWTHSMSAVGFGFSFGLVILENPGIDPKIIGVALRLAINFSHFASVFAEHTTKYETSLYTFRISCKFRV